MGLCYWPTKNHKRANNKYCPCVDYRFNGITPSLIRIHYYCDSGSDDLLSQNQFYTDIRIMGGKRMFINKFLLFQWWHDVVPKDITRDYGQ